MAKTQKVTTTTKEVKAVPTLTKADQTAVDAMTTKSAKIRFLDSKGFTRPQIANSFEPPIRYQHVRNVLITPLMKDIKAETK